MIQSQLESVQENEMHKILRDFKIQTISPNLNRKDRPNDSQQKKRTCHFIDFAVLADHRRKIKENKTRETSTQTLPEN